MFRIPAIPVTCAEVITRNTKPRQSTHLPTTFSANNGSTPPRVFWNLAWKYICEFSFLAWKHICDKYYLCWGDWWLGRLGRWIIIFPVPLLAWCLTNLQNITTLRANNLKTIYTTSLSPSLGEFSGLIPLLGTLWWPWWCLISLCPSFPPQLTGNRWT